MEDGKSYSLCQILRNELQFFLARLQSQGNIIEALGTFFFGKALGIFDNTSGIFGNTLGIFEGRYKGGKMEVIQSAMRCGQKLDGEEFV